MEDGNLENIPVKILVVEDNELNQKLICMMFKANGITCDLAVNGLEAVELFKRNRYNLIFMDCQMPVMDGFESTQLIRKMEENEKKTKIVAMTASYGEEDRMKCINSGMDDFLPKPIDFEKMFQIIKEQRVC